MAMRLYKFRGFVLVWHSHGVPTREIIHADMDAFYASVEQRDNPELRACAVAVGHGAKRGVVAAASYEARASVSARQCPLPRRAPMCGVGVRATRFDVYRAVSRQIHAIFADYTPLIEPLSLDEAYLDVTEYLRGPGTASATAQDIRLAFSMRTVSRPQRVFPTTSSLPSWRLASASRMASS
jgi:DNA polymerase-4